MFLGIPSRFRAAEQYSLHWAGPHLLTSNRTLLLNSARSIPQVKFLFLSASQIVQAPADCHSLSWLGICIAHNELRFERRSIGR